MKKQNLKIGDKLLCKNGLKTEYSIFIEGEYYLLGYFEIVNHKKCSYDDYVYYIDDMNHHLFSLLYEKDLYTYFYRQHEMRNMKLKKLNNAESEY